MYPWIFSNGGSLIIISYNLKRSTNEVLIMSEINDMYTIYFKYLIKMYGSLESSAPYRLVR